MVPMRNDFCLEPLTCWMNLARCATGFIVDYRVMLTMLRHFMSKASRTVGRTRVIMAVPCGIIDVEKRAMTDAIIQAGAREAYLVEAPVRLL